MTAFGCPVEPDVKRNFAIVSGWTDANVLKTAAESIVVVRRSKGVVR